MKLLIVTQKVDVEDPVLGFFHGWINEFSKKFEKVSVICLEKGIHDLPNNVKVYSLGKESGRSKIKYIKNFFNLILGLYKEYDSVFVHMNQEYVLLGGFIWKILRKKVYFWRNHPYGNLLTAISVGLSSKVFCTSPCSFTAKYKKAVLMPAGIDTEKFKIQNSKFKIEEKRNKILFLGRMSPIKRPDLLIESLVILKSKGTDFICDFYGDPLPKDEEYYKSLKNRVIEVDLSNQVNFYEGVPNYKTPEIYNEHNIFINLTATGSFDKTILEAVACGCIPVVTNKTLEQDFDVSNIASEDAQEIALKINFWLNAKEPEIKTASEKLQNYVLEKHSLNALINKLCTIIKK